MQLKKVALLWVLFCVVKCVNAQSQQQSQSNVLNRLNAYNVVWNSTSASSKGAMPLGNGDIGLNVWVENDGDLMLYIGKTDAWSEDVIGNEGLLKIGKMRFHFSTNPFKGGAVFLQTLQLTKGTIEIQANDTKIQVWVDANHPLIYIAAKSATPNILTVSMESLRSLDALAQKDTLLKSKLHPDKIFDNVPNKLAWVYENLNTKIPQLTNLKFGAIVQGEELVNTSPITLQNAKPQTNQLVCIAVNTTHDTQASQWLAVTQQKLPLEKDYAKNKQAHEAWWQQFWLRSWIFVDGNQTAEAVSKAYNLQRFVMACGGRGAYPYKFNGACFTVDDTLQMKRNGVNALVVVNGDYRMWGGRYWFQNTRHQYWPMLASGDFDMMQPFFNMYRQQITANQAVVKKMYGIDGLIFGEQQPFWGGLPNGTDAAVGGYGYHYFTQVLEFSAMMLDYYNINPNDSFLQTTLLPIANDGLRFFANRFKKDSLGKLVFEPANAMETYWKAKNPATDVAGFRYVLMQLMALPANKSITPEMKAMWQAYLNMAPNLSIIQKQGLPLINVAEATDGKIHNTENPELYAVFPFRLYGLNKPDLEIARNTFDKRRIKMVGCWHHDVLSAALLGKTTDAQNELVKICTQTNAKDGKMNGFRFPAFWGPGHDYAPDEDHGGIIMMALQYMLLQGNGNDVQLFPAWPKEWNVRFKLRAVGNKTVHGEFQNGEVVRKTVVVSK